MIDIFIHLGAAGNNVRDGFLCSYHRGLNQEPEFNPKGLSGAKFGDQGQVSYGI